MSFAFELKYPTGTHWNLFECWDDRSVVINIKY